MAYRSLDTDFLTLRNVTAYNPNNTFVSTNYVFTAGTNGNAVWTSSLNINSLNLSTLTASSISATNAQITNAQITNAQISSANIGNFTTNNISTNNINITSTINTGPLGINMINNLGITSVLDTSNNPNLAGITLLFNGASVLTGNSISSISSLHWEGTGVDPGAIYNTNGGTNDAYKYLVGIGTEGTSTLGTLDVLYAGDINASKAIIGNFRAKDTNTSTLGFEMGIAQFPNGVGGTVSSIVPKFSIINRDKTDFSLYAWDNDGVSSFYKPQTLGLYAYPYGSSTITTFILAADSVTGNIGIGQIDPLARLHVNGDAIISSNLYTTNASLVSLNLQGSDFNLQTIGSSSTLVQNNSGGSLILGTLNYSSMIQLNNNNTLNITSDDITLGNNAIVGGAIVNINGTSGFSRVYDPVYNPVPGGGEDVYWRSTIANPNNITNNNSGNIGIGVTNPLVKLEVLGDTNITSYNAINLAVDGGSDVTGVQIMPSSISGSMASLIISNGSGATVPTKWRLLCSDITGGGITANNLQLWKYPSYPDPAGCCTQILDIDYKGENTTFGTGIIINSHIIDSGSGIYTVGGIHTVTIPIDANTLNFTILGAGGNQGTLTLSGPQGTGGYISGSINVKPFRGQTLTIQVGQSIGLGSTASYISIISGGPLLVIAGSGGNGGSTSGSNGGSGGGGIFTSGIANGSNGAISLSGGAGGGGGGSTIGGLGGIAGSGFLSAPGNNGNNPSGFTDVSGGAGAFNDGNGGNGYAGGGGAGNSGGPGGSNGGGGGGSSYINTTYVTIGLSYNGDLLPTNILTGYGRIGQDGYISLQFIGGPSLTTANDIICGEDIICAENIICAGNIICSGDINVVNTYYEYCIPSQAINGDTSDVGWPNGTYISNLNNTVGDPGNTLLTDESPSLLKVFWNCPQTGLWQICLNLADASTSNEHIVIGNLTTNRPIGSNKSSSTVFINQGDRILISGNYGLSYAVYGSVSMLLVMPSTPSISIPAQALLTTTPPTC